MVASKGWPAGVLIGVGLSLTLACSPPAGPAATPVVARPQHLLLVTVDTLRADRVGSYGYARAKTPAMDALARAGVRFDRAFAPAPITLTSHATLLTGLNPPGHGARHNGMPVRDGVATLATALADAGFTTAAFVSAFPLDRRFGLARGFAVYDDRLPRQDDGRPADERAGASTVDAARAWLDEHRVAPFFLWVHLFEPHAPYGDSAHGPLARSAQDRYDDEVAEADRQIARLLDGLGAARRSTLVVVAADHGEAFGEHGEVAHSIFVYDTTLRVPLIMSGPGVPDRSLVVNDAVGLVDVAPTLLALLGRPAITGDGVDLRGSFEGKAVGARVLYAESFAPLVDFGWSPLRVARAGRWKYIAAPRPELYDLDRDAAELRDVLADHRDVAAALAPRVEAVSAASLGPAVQTDRHVAARLESLGYVSARTRAANDAARPDPKDRKAIASRIAGITAGEVPPDQLVPALEQLLRDDPGNPFAQLRLGAALADRGACEPAERHLRAAIRAGTPTADPFLSLAYCYRQRGATADAERALESAERAEPGSPVVAANRGLIAFDAGRLHDAIELLDAAVTREPDLHMARFFLARAYARTGQRAPAHAQAVTLLSRLPASAPQRAEVERLVAALADPSTR
jgi:arylsulfatase A-like enzyme/Tfp pilus assembly protein PilF